MAKLYNFQEDAVRELLSGKRFVVSGVGSGKTAMALTWAREKCEMTGKNKVLVVTTASKVKTGDFEAEADEWCGEGWRQALAEFQVVSWHKLVRWTNEYQNELSEWVVIFDECQRAKAGVSSGMGRAFLKITSNTDDWSAFTGTPGDTWLSFYPYFTACKLVRNKTVFMNRYAIVQTYKGFPEIIGWREEKHLSDMWKAISYAPDTERVMSELPEQIHKTVLFKKTPEYSRVLKTRENSDGEFLDTSGALCAELRRACFTKDKQEWVKDFVEGLDAGCVFFYNFVTTGDKLEEIIRNALPSGARVWRIDGKHHEIPTEDTIGKHDIVLCQWQSGSEALNLQFLHYWVSVEACYSYSTSIQARGRIRRLGQKWVQHYWYLKTTNTIEDDIYDCLKRKGEFSEKVWCVNNNLIEEGEE